MSELLEKLLQARAESRQEAEWPLWIVQALAHNPENPPVVDSPTKAAPSNTDQ
ncbi:hypothetical protein ACVWZZ_001169 [Bradyrhizobium sp. LM6.10]